MAVSHVQGDDKGVGVRASAMFKVMEGGERRQPYSKLWVGSEGRQPCSR